VLNPCIKGRNQSLADIKGPFNKNLFYGAQGRFLSFAGLLMPKDTSIRLHHRERSSSEGFTIENQFLTIDIGIAFLVTWSQGFVFAEGPDAKRPYRDLLRFETCIYYDVKYKRTPYGFADRKYHEEWAEDLFSVLQRRFSWGNPRLAEHAETARYFRQMAETQRQQLGTKPEGQPK
jgi:hypothetical protein